MHVVMLVDQHVVQQMSQVSNQDHFVHLTYHSFYHLAYIGITFQNQVNLSYHKGYSRCIKYWICD